MLNIVTPYTVIDPELAPYDEEFQFYLKKYCSEDKYLNPIQKSIYFADLAPNNIAYCQTNRVSSMVIVYNIHAWKQSTLDQKFSTMMHESVHCYFGVGHVEDENHFMFAYENYLDKSTVINQLESFLKEQCK